MSITTNCPGCNALFRLADNLAGKKVRCQKCQLLFVVPAPASDAPTIDDAPKPLPVPPPLPPEVTMEHPPPEQAAAPETRADDKASEEPATHQTPPAAKATGAPRPEQPSGPSPFATVAALGVLAVVTIGIGLASMSWVFANLGPPRPVIVGTPMTFKKIDLISGMPLGLDVNGQAAIRGQVGGGSQRYRVQMWQGMRYNIHVLSGAIEPRVELFDGHNVVAENKGKNSTFLSWIARRNAEHMITVHNARGVQGEFELKVATAVGIPFRQDVAFGQNPTYIHAGTLRIQDPVSLNWLDSPFHSYRVFLVQGKEYEFSLESAAFVPVLQLRNDQNELLHEWTGDGEKGKVQGTYKAPNNSAITAFVMSEDGGLGVFTFRAHRKPEFVDDTPGPREVKFDDAGKYHRDDILTLKCPVEGKLGRIKTYYIPMTAGFGYNIEQKSAALDSYLTLYDPQGKVVAEDNNSGTNFNARILFDAKASGRYRLLASDFKRKEGQFEVDIERIVHPFSMEVNVPMTEKKREQAGCAIAEASAPPVAMTYRSFAWAPDGKAFFTLDNASTLRRFRYPDFVEERKLAVMKGCLLYESSEGLVLSSAQQRELWIVDPQTLELKRRLPRIGGVLFTAPTLSVAYSGGNVLGPDKIATPGVFRHDLTKPNFAYFGKQPPGVFFQSVTRDGQSFIGRDGGLRLQRFKLDAGKLTLEETSRFLAHSFAANEPYAISPDGKVLVHPINATVFPKDDFQPLPASNFGLAAYRIDDLKKPMFVVDTGVATNSVAFARNGLLLAHNRSKGLMVIDAEGKVVRTLQLDVVPGLGVDVWGFAAHPDGDKVSFFFGPRDAPQFFVVDLPKDLAP